MVVNPLTGTMMGILQIQVFTIVKSVIDHGKLNMLLLQLVLITTKISQHTNVNEKPAKDANDKRNSKSTT